MKQVYLTFGVLLTLCIVLFFSFRSKKTPEIKKNHPSRQVFVRRSPFIYQYPDSGFQQILVKYDSFITKSIRGGMAPGAAVVIVRDTSIVFLKGFGLRNSQKKEPVDINTVFRLASVSKCFASLLTGVLVDENKLRWDDPVIKYLPTFKLKSDFHTQNLTLRHVLSHTTGLPYHAFTDRVDQGANFDTLVYHLRDLDLYGMPGQYYSYQNVGYSLIGSVIESTTGKTYEENLRDHIFSPLKMVNASASYEAIMENPNTAQPHRFHKGWVPMNISNTYYNVAPAGGVNASISDLGHWLLALASSAPPIVSENTRDTLFLPVVRAISRNANFRQWKPLRSAWYALGWRVLQFRNDTLLYHGGYVNGYRSEVVIDRKNKLSMAVLVNAPGTLADISIPRFLLLFTNYQREAYLKKEDAKNLTASKK
jgi:beta-lactamase class C